MPEERRRSERTSTQVPITLHIGPTGDVVERLGTRVNLSEHGAHIVTNAELTIGQSLEIHSYRGYVSPVRARVLWMRVATFGPSIEAGLEFLD
jgi:PilZ domain